MSWSRILFLMSGMIVSSAVPSGGHESQSPVLSVAQLVCSSKAHGCGAQISAPLGAGKIGLSTAVAENAQSFAAECKMKEDEGNPCGCDSRGENCGSCHGGVCVPAIPK